jgi:hypothetical protein
MDDLPYQRSITAPTGANMRACSISLMSYAHDAHGEVDLLADLRDASRERLLTEIGMLRQLNGTVELAAARREVLASRDAVYGMSAELGELRARLKTDVQYARQTMMQAPTWRVGVIVLSPLKFAKRLLRKK